MDTGFFRLVSMVIFPRTCAGCGRRDAVLCTRCTELLRRWRERCIAHSFMVFSCGQYTRSVRNAVLAWKDHADEELDAAFTELLCARVLAVLGAVLRRDTELCVVPAPSSQKSVRTRGRAHMEVLARRLVRKLNDEAQCQGSDFHVHMCPSLSIDARIRKSVTASQRKERAERLNKGLMYTQQHPQGESCMAILLDDIVTTGSTLRACVRMLRAQGVNVLGAFTLSDADRHTLDNV